MSKKGYIAKYDYEIDYKLGACLNCNVAFVDKTKSGCQKHCSVKCSNNFYYKNNLKKHKIQSKKAKLKKEYGMTPEQYSTLFELHGACCHICKTHRNNLKKDLAVDHCHITGKIRGLLCDKCNHGLGNFKDNLELLQEAQRYLILAHQVSKL